MVDFEYEELMNRSIDGQLSPDEQTKLDKYLETHPEAVRYYDNIKRTKAVLDRVPQADPPAGLTQNIMAAVRSRSRKTQEKQSLLEFIRDRLRRKTAWKYAYSFVAGAVCGVVVLVISLNLPETQVPINPAHVSGTLLNPQRLDNIPVSDERSFMLGTAEVILTTKQTEELIILEVDVTGHDESALALSYNADDIVFSGLMEPDGFSGDLEFQDGFLTLKQNTGGSCIILFDNMIRDTSKLIVESRTGAILHTEEIVLTPADN